MASPTKYSIIVIGGGIGGLVSANFLRKQGHRVTVIEAKQHYLESNSAGGIQLTMNAQRAFDALGLLEKFRSISDSGSVMYTKRYSDGSIIKEVEKPSHQHSFVHRMDFLNLLHEQAVEAGVEIHPGELWQSIEETEDSVSVRFGNGKVVTADVVIGSDGINSKVRDYIPATRGVKAVPTGSVTFLVEVSKAAMENYGSTADLYESGRAPFHMWVGPERAIVGWTMESRSKREVYHLQFCDFAYNKGEKYGECDNPETRLVATFTDIPKFLRRWDDFEDAVKYMIQNQQLLIKWRMAEVPPLSAWTSDSGRIVLLGDAAHCFEPFAGQGAAMAVEDAAAFATLISQANGCNPWREIGQAYYNMRKPRVERMREIVQENVRDMGMADGQEQESRDARMGRAESNAWSSQERYIWIENYDVIAEARAYDLGAAKSSQTVGKGA